jgi:signal recognition particle subunit SRP54
MFDALSDRLDSITKRLKGRGRLSEADLDEALLEIRTALLEADVDFGVVRGFIAGVKERLVGIELSKALSPGQQVVKAVHDELIRVLGGETLKITYAQRPPTVILLAGLQGAGKTTAAAKLARWFKQQGRNPILVAADLQRPAAIQQLQVLGDSIGIPVVTDPAGPVASAKAGIAEATRVGRDVVIVDTAGRLAIDEALMDEVAGVSRAAQPTYTFLVIDAMIGQDAVQTALAFHERLALDGVILTKLDGDARGGAALSVAEVVGRPIAFASTGEKLEDLDLFHPDRMADRILGMGDVMSLIEQAEATMDADVVSRSAGRMMSGTFTLDDFLDQLGQVRKMGSMGGIMKLMPGMSKQMRQAADQIDDRHLDRLEGMVHSMTKAERNDPSVIDGSRRRRIANGAGVTTQDINQLLNQFKQMQKMMRSMGGAGSMGKGRIASAKAMMSQRGMDPSSLGDGMGNLSLPPQLRGLGAPSAASGSPTRPGSKNKKKKGGRATPRKDR